VREAQETEVSRQKNEKLPKLTPQLRHLEAGGNFSKLFEILLTILLPNAMYIAN
jgi:hypothetical protein